MTKKRKPTIPKPLLNALVAMAEAMPVVISEAGRAWTQELPAAPAPPRRDRRRRERTRRREE